MVLGAAAATLRQLIEPPLDALGYEVLHLEMSTSAGSRCLRVYIDAPGGICVDDCATVSRQLSALLEVEDALPPACALEVSSPGLDRPLVTAEHFRRFVGSRARIVLRAPLRGQRSFIGELLEAGEACVAIEVDGERYELAYNDMDTARLAPVF